MFLGLLSIVHLILIVPTSAEPLPYEPTDSMVINCGESKGPKWSPQNSPKLEYSTGLHEITVPKASTQSSGDSKYPELYGCIFKKQISYTFTVSAGMKFIRLHFYPTSYEGLNISKALFSVSIGHYTLLRTSESSYSIAVESTLKEFCINVDGSILNITFTPRSFPGAYGFVNKIEIVSMPPNLYIQARIPLPLIGHRSKFFIVNSTALEVMYRLNVGGHLIPAEADTGMLRIWSEDTPYLNEATNTATMHSKVDIKYRSSVPPYTAPLKVYATARTMEQNWYYNLTWFFPLESGFYYLIRLHFCEIMRDISQVNQRVFQIYINNQSAENHADVIQWSDGAGVPVYRDYVVNFSGYSQGILHLSLALQSKTGLTTTHNDAFLNGLEIFKLSDHNKNLAGFYPFGNRTRPYEDSRPEILRIPIAFLSGFVALVILLYIFLHFPTGWCPSILRFSLLRSPRRTLMQWASSDYCRYFSLAEIKLATNNFCDVNLIGAGGFGKVYKGCIEGGATTVAIKRGSPSSHQGLHEFQTEITLLSKLRHRHLVSLIGYCMDDNEMILVYDFMARGTLRDHLYNTQNTPLPWKQRLKICIDAARGLHYLHNGTKQTIIHRDIKTTNILLDKRWVAKVADFGLSKVGPNMISHTHVSTAVKGSFGYMDPEYYRRQKLTEKSDVYSFGVVLFEVLCARPAVLPMVVEEEEELEQVNLANWALRCHQMGTLDQIIDPCLRGKIDPECLKTFTEIAKKCLADRGSERPPMGNVLWNLELAWQQQEGADAEEEERMCGGTSRRTAGEITVTIDGQQCLSIANSDLTPGAEFSEIMAPVGR